MPVAPLTRRDLVLAAALSLLALSLLLGWRLGNGLWGALGTDAALWGLTAMDLRVGADPLVPPGYPALVALFYGLGASLVAAGLGVSLVAASLLPGVAYAGLRALGLGRLAAAPVALLLASPDLVAWSQQLQPDALASLMLVTVGLALALSPASAGAAWVAVVGSGLLPLVREHGLPLVALSGLALATTGPGRRWPRVLALLALWWLAPLLVGVLPGPLPTQLPWSDRAGGALAALTADSPEGLSFLRELRPQQRQAYGRLLLTGDRLGQLGWHLRRSLALAADAWALLGLSALALSALTWWRPQARRAALGLGLPLLTALPALLIWSQRRHVALLVPLALLGLLYALAQAPRWLRGLCGAALLVLVLAWPGRLRSLAAEQRTERPRAEHFAELGGWLAAQAPAGALLGGIFQDVGLYHPLPRHDPDGSPADWRTYLLSDRPPPPSALGRWTEVHRVGGERGPDGQSIGGIGIFQLDPGLVPRPCAGLALPPRSAYLAVDRAHVELPACGQPSGADGSPPPR